MDKNTLILCYHNIALNGENLHLYDVHLQAFADQMRLLKAMPNVEVAEINSSESSDRLDVLLTFDDGYKSWSKEVLELLKSFGFKAYFFVCIENLYKWNIKKNRDRHVITKEDIIKLKDNGMVIGSHSLKHRFLHLLSEKEIRYELKKSKEILEGMLGQEVRYFSVPRGIHNEKIVRIARDIGYEFLFTSKMGVNNGLDFVLKRVPVKRDTELRLFSNIINGKAIKKMTFVQESKDMAKKLLGIGAYNSLRKLAVKGADDD